MANIHLKSSCNGGNINLGDAKMPQYVGARAEVSRTEDGVKIRLSDYKGTTEEVVTDGVGISSIEKTSASGLVDTYTITYTDGTTSTFTVTNGEDGGGDNIFWATYGTTTSAEIDAAYNSGALVCVKKDGTTYTLTTRLSATFHIFSANIDDTHHFAICDNDEWGELVTPLNHYDIQWVAYGVTRSADIEAAYQNDQLVCVVKDGLIYTLSRRYDSSQHHFTCVYNGHLYELVCEANVWTSSDTSLDAVYWATYGTTTNLQIIQALSAGKMVIVDYGSRAYTLTKSNGSASQEFSCVRDNTEYRVACNNDVWTAAQYDLSDIFWATYGTTTSAEIEAAIDAGKLVCVYMNYCIYTLAYTQAYINYYRFHCSLISGVVIIQCENDVWSSYGEVNFITTTAKGAAYGVCPLDANGKVDASYLPVYNGGVS